MPDSAPRKTGRVLVLDRAGEERTAWVAVLEEAGWRVVCYDSVPEARTVLEQSQLDVVVAEIACGPGGALDLLAQLGDCAPRSCIICTSHKHESRHVLECLRGGAADYLQRPCTPARLLGAVEATVEVVADNEAIDIEIGEMGWIELRMPSSERSMRRLDKFFRLLYETQVSAEVLEEISLCFTEVVRNAIEWGNRSDITKQILLSHMLFQDEIVFKVHDSGCGFDVSTMFDEPDDLIAMETERERMGKRPGGLGITMVRGFMDSVIYNKTGNMIVMSKKLYDAD